MLWVKSEMCVGPNEEVCVLWVFPQGITIEGLQVEKECK